MIEALPLIWFILIAVLWTGYLVLEGFDFGVGMLLTILPSRDPAKRDRHKRTMLSAIGPHWDGNEVWLITAGGAMFAAFPEWYATAFSGMYLALLLILLALIVRICAIEWRGKISSPTWGRRWDVLHSVCAWVPAVLWGVAFANFIQGMAIERDAGGSAQLTGGLGSLITPFTLLGGVTTALLFLAHGMVFLAWKTAGEVHERAEKAAKPLSAIAAVVAIAFAVWAQLAYSAHAWTWVAVAVVALGSLTAVAFARAEREAGAFAGTAASILAFVVLVFGGMFPDVMRSSIDPAFSLGFREAAATGPTLTVMSVVALIFVPVVVAYQAWTYWVFRKRINADVLPDEAAGLPPVMVEAGPHAPDDAATVPETGAGSPGAKAAGPDDGTPPAKRAEES
jgi:cytochrome d ubiquinol oxidase subunit II